MVKIVIPFKITNPKSRLSSVLSIEERVQLAKLMLLDVIDAITECFKSNKEITVLVPSITNEMQEFRKEVEEFYNGVTFKEDPGSLDEAINQIIGTEKEVAIVMSDLPLLTSRVLQRFFNCDGDVVISPGRKGGTNMLLVRDSRFRVSYHYGSFIKHLKIAEQLGIKATVFDSFYASVDIDDESDLLELMLHGTGKKSWKYLVELGFDVDFSKKDPTILEKTRKLDMMEK